MARAEAAEVSVRQVRAEPEGTIRLGFYGAASFRLLPHLIIALRDRYPRVRLDLRELDAVGQNEAFSFGRLDLGLVRPSAQPEGLAVDPILRERLLVALRHDHPLAKRSRLRPADFVGRPFIGYSPEATYMHDLVRSVLSADQAMPEIAQQVAHAQAMLSLVSAGLGMSIVPEHARFAGIGDVVFRPLVTKEATAITHLVSAEDARRPVVSLVRHAFLEAGAALEAERG